MSVATLHITSLEWKWRRGKEQEKESEEDLSREVGDEMMQEESMLEVM